MTRRYALAIGSLGGALLAGVALTVWIAERRLLALRTDFAAASLVRLEQVTRDVEERFQDIGDHLRLGGELVQAATTRPSPSAMGATGPWHFSCRSAPCTRRSRRSCCAWPPWPWASL